MTYARRLILALALSAGIAPALAQVPPPVPALPDTERRTAYTISASTCICNVNFAIYGDGTDYANWLEVFVNGALIPASGNWTITSPTGSLGSIPRPITDAVLTFTNAQTGTVQIVGARRPRRVSQFNENQGVPARNLNQALTDIIAQNRELWDKTNDITGRGLFSQPGVSLGLLPLPSVCAGKFLSFDITGLIPQCLSGGAGSGNVVGPVSPSVGDVALFADTTGTVITNVPTKPLVILATGQSNFVLTPAFTWTPAPNVKIWNNVINTDGSVGTAYVPLSATTVNIAWKEASDIAAANPTRQVCLIDVAFSNRAISHWLTGTSAPDVYANITSNITAALAACGATKIDLFLWWQGEADAVIPTLTYPADWATMIARFWGNSWFPQETPVVVHGLESIYGSYISFLLGVVNADPDKRRFVYTSSLSGATYWDASNPGHMTGQGYFSAGAMGASAYLHGGRNTLPTIISDPATGYTSYGPFAVVPSDPFTFVFNGQIAQPATTGAVRSMYGANGGNSVDINQAFGGAPENIQSRFNGTYNAPTKLLADDIMGIWGARGYDSAGPVAGNKAALLCAASGIWTAPNHGTYCDVYVTPTGTDATAATVRFLNGSMLFFGTVSGFGTLTWPATIGSPTWTLPTNTGTFAVSASSPLAIDAATGNATCPTCGVTGSPLSQFAATTSAQLRGVLSDESGTGPAVFGTSPNITTPTGIVKGDVGLGNVDNTSDATKNAATATLASKTLTAPILTKGAFSTLSACATGTEGMVAAVTDSSTAVWGATITGSSTNHVLAYCDGTQWTVAGK